MSNRAPLSLKTNVAWNTVGNVFYQGCQWLTTVLVVNLSTGFDNSGILAFAMTVGNVFYALATYNMRTYQISDTENIHAPGAYLAFRFITTGGALLACALYAALVSSSVAMCVAIVAFLVFKADEALVSVFFGIDQKASRMDYIGQSQILRGILSVGLFSTGLLVFDDLCAAVLLMAVGCMAVTWALDFIRAKGLVAGISLRIGRVEAVSLLRECLPATASLALGGAIVALARQVFWFGYGDAALGIYAAVATPSVVIQVLAANLYYPMLSPIAEAYNAGDARSAGKRTVKLVLLVFVVGAVVTVILGALGAPLLRLFYGDVIVEYVYLLVPALILATLIGLASLVCDLFIVVRRLSRALAVNVFILVLTACAIVPCIATWYMNGISFALIIGYGCGVAAGLAMLARVLRKQDER